jgi:capsular polysaccharide transport system permease protein
MNAMSNLAGPLEREAAGRRALLWIRRPFSLIVLLPTLLVASYLFLIASDQYRSEAQFVVRSIQADAAPAGGVGQLLGLSGVLSPGQREAQSIREYLMSMDAIAALKRKGIDLVAVYRRAGVDPLSRLWSDKPRAEALRDYYRAHVDILYDPDDAITRVSVHAFRPEDAQRIAQALLALGEARVNTFNDRLFKASFAQAQANLASAQSDLGGVQVQLSVFRERNRDIDPQGSGEGGLKLVEEQQAALDGQRTLLDDMSRQLSPRSPQVMAQRGRVAALAQSLETSRGRLTGAPKAVSSRLGVYENLKLQQDFAAKRYEAARASLEAARDRADKDRLFVVEVVQPNLPEKPDLPRPVRNTTMVLIALLLAYGIGWMLIAGIREHQA